jgi:hypothetical protein
MIPPIDWTPTPADVAWQESMLRVLKDGATWAVPISLSAFIINKTAKTFKLSTGDPNDETNRRIAVVFNYLGYTETDSDNTPRNRVIEVPN